MRIRSFIFITIIALGLIPLFILVSLNLPRTVARFESAAGLEAQAVSKAGFTRLNAKIRCINKSLLRSSTLPYAPALLKGDGSGGELESILLQWFRDDAQVVGVTVHNLSHQPELSLVRDSLHDALRAIAPPQDFSTGKDIRINTMQHGKVYARVVEAEMLPDSTLTSDQDYFLQLSTPVTDTTGDRLGVVSVLLDLYKFLDDYHDSVWVNTNGIPMYGCTTLLPQPDIDNEWINSSGGCGDGRFDVMLAANSAPYLSHDHFNKNKTAWMPLIFEQGAEPVMWVGSPVDESSIHQWKRSLLINVLVIVCLMTVVVFFVAGVISRRMDGIRKELLQGLDRIMRQGKEVSFQWRGPKEIAQLAEDINALSRQFVEVAEQRNRAERVYRESEEKFRRLAQSAQDVIILITSRGMVAYWNKAAEHFFGLKSEQVLEKNIKGVFQIDSSAPGVSLESLMDDSPLYGSGKPVECTIRTKNRGAVAVEFALSSASISGKWHGIWIVRDISERKKNEEMAIKQQQQLLHADKMISLGLLVSGVAHEINNPNSIALLNVPMLSKSWNTILPVLDEYWEQNGDFSVAGIEYSEMREQIPQMCMELEESAVRIRQIVKDLKDYARQEAVEEFQEVDVNEVVHAAVRLTKAAIGKVTGALRVDYGQDLPKVLGVKQRLIQVVINLIQNSCDAPAAKDKPLLIETRFAEDGEVVEIMVEDEGGGIEPEVVDKVTDPFFTTRRSSGGTGLGLSVSSGIIKQHDGKIHIDSQYGKGTRVVVQLPVQKRSIGLEDKQ